MSEAEPAKVAAADQEQAAKADPKARARANSAPQPVIEPKPCEGCREYQEATDARLARIDERITAIGKLVVTAGLAALAIYFLQGAQSARASAAVES